MAKLSDLYDDQVMDSLTPDAPKGAAEEASKLPLKFDEIADPEFEYPVGTVAFSKLFHKPTLIPDIPVMVFNKSDWPTEAQMYIPEVDPNWVWNKKVLEQLAIAMYCNDTTLLWGLQGTGKSCTLEQWCAVCGIPFWRMNCNRETREQHFLGAPSLDYDEEGRQRIIQEPTTLIESLTYGGMFCEDESFRHNSALVLQSLREKTTRTVVLPDAPGRSSTDRKITAPEGRWWYCMTDNTCGSGDETGIFDAEVQDASSTDRIDAAIQVPYLGKPEERKMLKNHTNLNEDIINGMLDVAKQIRQAFKKGHMMNTMSVRGLLAWGEKIEMTQSIGFALQLSMYNKLGIDDQKQVEDIFHQVFERNING